MSAFPGWTNFLVVSSFYCVFFVEVIICTCINTESSKCSTLYCIKEPTNNRCANSSQRNCSLYATTSCAGAIQWPTVPNKAREVKVLYIEVYRRQTAWGLRLAFQLPSGVYLSSVKGVRVTIADNKGSTSQLCSPCHLFDLRGTTQSECGEPPTLRTDCISGVTPGVAYKATFTTLPLNISSNFIVTLPKDLSSTDPATLEDWRSVLSVSVMQSNLKVLFQRAPGRFKVKRYQLRIWNSISVEPIVQELDHDTNSYTRLDLESGEYHVTINAISNNCTLSKCPMTSSRKFDVPSEDSIGPVTTTLPSTVAPNVVQLIIGIVGGVFLMVAVVVISVACYCRRKYKYQGGFQMRRFQNGQHDATSFEFRQVPRLLLLYSYDCPSHWKVVQAFALYLKEVLNCNVRLDIWHQTEVQERGSHEWVGQELESADIVIVVCSAGARFKCSRHRQKYRLKHDQGMADIFRRSIEMVSQRMWYIVNHQEFVRRVQFAAVYFPYCTESDVPHKLDQAPKFSLMKEVGKLFTLLQPVNSTGDNMVSVDETTYMLCDSGAELHRAILEASEFFESNPNWFQERIDVKHPQREPEAKPGPADSINTEVRAETEDNSEVVQHNDIKPGSNCDTSVNTQVALPVQHQKLQQSREKKNREDDKFNDDSDADLSQDQFDRDVSFIRNYDQEVLNRASVDHQYTNGIPLWNSSSFVSNPLSTQPV